MTLVRRVALYATIVAASCVGGFILIQGVASSLLFANDVLRSGRNSSAERQHTRYDRELGWSNIPGINLPDMYGPGRALRINAQGFRDDAPTTQSPPAGKIRAICSGDSFTLGYGVSNNQTWCHLLETLSEGLETVNMGQGGYGVDQAYLWYMRDGRKLNHQLQIFAMITPDFWRMQQSSFEGIPKPYFSLAGDSLVLHNVPVPMRTRSPLSERVAIAFAELPSTELVRRGRDKLTAGGPATASAETGALNSRSFALSVRLLTQLETANEQKHSHLEVVWLPERTDFGSTSSDGFRRRLAGALAVHHIAFVDLVPPFRKLPLQEAEAMFIPEGELQYPGAAGHYNVAGNDWVAHELLDQMMTDSTTANLIERGQASRHHLASNTGAHGLDPSHTHGE